MNGVLSSIRDTGNGADTRVPPSGKLDVDPERSIGDTGGGRTGNAGGGGGSAAGFDPDRDRSVPIADREWTPSGAVFVAGCVAATWTGATVVGVMGEVAGCAASGAVRPARCSLRLSR
jgi:hypothetical protein